MEVKIGQFLTCGGGDDSGVLLPLGEVISQF